MLGQSAAALASAITGLGESNACSSSLSFYIPPSSTIEISECRTTLSLVVNHFYLKNRIRMFCSRDCEKHSGNRRKLVVQENGLRAT